MDIRIVPTPRHRMVLVVTPRLRRWALAVARWTERFDRRVGLLALVAALAAVTAASAQTPVYTNATLARRATAPVARPSAETMAGLVARQYPDAVPPARPSYIPAPTPPAAPQPARRLDGTRVTDPITVYTYHAQHRRDR